MRVTLEEIQRIVGLVFGSKKIKPDSHFMEDLGADSADIINVIVAVEDKFAISIDDSEIPDLLRVEDLFLLVQERAGETFRDAL